MNDIAKICDELNIVDAFAFRRVEGGQLVNLAGHGRGAGWAGNVTIDAAIEPVVASAINASGVLRAEVPDRPVFGPYWSKAVALTCVGDFIVAFGGAGVEGVDDARLIEAAGEITWDVSAVSAEKRLADELEVTQAALAVANLSSRSEEEFLAGLPGVAVQSLACEFAVVRVASEPPRVVISDSAWRPSAEDADLARALEPVANAVTGSPLVEQDVGQSPLAESPFGAADGIVARCTIPLRDSDEPMVLVAAHTDLAPRRGFTTLCERVAKTIGEQATLKLAQISAEPHYQPMARTR